MRRACPRSIRLRDGVGGLGQGINRRKRLLQMGKFSQKVCRRRGRRLNSPRVPTAYEIAIDVDPILGDNLPKHRLLVSIGVDDFAV